jgi:hypothetical protein
MIWLLPHPLFSSSLKNLSLLLGLPVCSQQCIKLKVRIQIQIRFKEISWI